ncbi:CRISPR-associated endonuclease Cas1 [Saccharopolyspora phatthalungensis]|uniref:CRISPR-associated endonuclease Cas1 n=1 Tax=Saccharopolyspora phatthalungensis TaxID=664693 RepID=A0A840Q9T9_9PSEU|nr:CRISPR-associated endonuclease Cas1 [Saccharopolyspora phatthalungensis]MBB5156610.1 CRISPR-associated endonuclease Cas1 [Saccharopolyspora phatthalungensis]
MLTQQRNAPTRAHRTLPEGATATAAIVYGRTSTDPRVIIADGRNVQLRVERGQLSIQDGIGQHRRIRTLPRIERDVRRIIVLADNGYVSWDAARWCADVGITVVQVDRSGRQITATAEPRPGTDDVRLRRAQAFASDDGPHAAIGLDIAKYILARKLDGQAAIATEYLNNPDASDIIRQHAAEVAASEDIGTARVREGAAGAAYWQAWSGRVIVPFEPRELRTVPAHWTTFVARRSCIDTAKTNGHHAADPINALLNYSYWLAETECRLACLAVGLDPAMGFHHADKPNRDSLALDLLEILRPDIDRFVLDLLCTNGPMRYLSPKLFVEESDGHCRLVPPLTHLIAEQCLDWTRSIAPHAAHIARMLAASAKGDVRPAKSRKQSQPGTRRKYTPARPLRLSGTVTVERIIPDHLWADIAPLLPPEPQKRGVGRPRADNRAVLAGIVCVEQLGCTYSRIPPTLGASASTCRIRLDAWQEADIWPAIERVLHDSDHIRQLRAEADATPALNGRVGD